MNDQDFIYSKVKTPFFFENKIYEFSQKKMSPQDRTYMKSMLQKDIVSKKKVASALMALEYMDKLSGSSFVDLDASAYVVSLKKKKVYLHLALGFLFTVIFILSGFLLLKMYWAGEIF